MDYPVKIVCYLTTSDSQLFISHLIQSTRTNGFFDHTFGVTADPIIHSSSAQLQINIVMKIHNFRFRLEC